jgi:hypothetical protein
MFKGMLEGMLEEMLKEMFKEQFKEEKKNCRKHTSCEQLRYCRPSVMDVVTKSPRLIALMQYLHLSHRDPHPTDATPWFRASQCGNTSFLSQ